MWLKIGKCPLNILVGTRSYKKGENTHLTSVRNKTEYQLAGMNTELDGNILGIYENKVKIFSAHYHTTS